MQKISVAGYAYDRVQAIRDGLVGIDGADVRFHDREYLSPECLGFWPGKIL